MRILVVAGEASADLHASHVIAKLKELSGKNLELIGVGGDRLQQEGLNPLKSAREMAVVGFTEVLKKIPQTLKLLGDLEKLAAKERPDFALLLDLPDFNLRLAPKLKRLGIPVIYYISPQVWAWRAGRVQQMSTCIDLLLTILPFEKPWYNKNAPTNLRVEYVGHPAIEEVPALAFQPNRNVVALLPGSRESEMDRLLSVFLDAAVLLKTAKPELQFHLPLAEPLRKSEMARALLSPMGPNASAIRFLGDNLRVEEVPAHEILRKAKLALVASGTATLETAIVGTPMVVLYKVTPTTAFIFKHFVGYQGAIAMANLVHRGLGSLERVVPELLQDEVTAEKVSNVALSLLDNPELWQRQATELAKTRQILSGAGTPVANAANAILSFLGERA